VQCFWATALFLAGNRMTIVAFEKEDFIALFSSWRRACLVLKHNRVSEFLKGLRSMILSITVKEIAF